MSCESWIAIDGPGQDYATLRCSAGEHEGDHTGVIRAYAWNQIGVDATVTWPRT